MEKAIVEKIQKIALSMYRKDFIGIFHGSISLKHASNRFIINKRNAIFDEIDDNHLMELLYKRDYRWNEASIDADIHLNIYQNIPEAKYIAHVMPPYLTALTLKYSMIVPQDYFGSRLYPEIEVYDPQNFDTWYERAEHEIYTYFKKTQSDLMVIKGYGIYTYDRDIEELAKKIAVIENSCKLLLLKNAATTLDIECKA
jgi:L-fuculose-phosphate aldolase